MRWDIDIKIGGKFVGHLYQKSWAVPLSSKKRVLQVPLVSVHYVVKFEKCRSLIPSKIQKVGRGTVSSVPT